MLEVSDSDKIIYILMNRNERLTLKWLHLTAEISHQHVELSSQLQRYTERWRAVPPMRHILSAYNPWYGVHELIDERHVG
jgi:hypothetical protein